MAEYDTFIDNMAALKALPQGQEIDLTIRELIPKERRNKYTSCYVKAMVADSKDKLAGSEVLWIRFQRGALYPKPWAIKIVAELGEYQPQVAAYLT